MGHAIELSAAGLCVVLVAMMAAMTASASAVPPGPITGHADAANDSRMFLRQAAAAGVKEVQDSRDALDRVKRPEVRDMAQTLIDDHTRTNDKLGALAKRKGWEVGGGRPAGSPTPQNSEGAGDPDASFLSEQISGHEKTIADFRRQSESGDDADARQFAKETLPTLEHHLQELQKLQRPQSAQR
jgi:putative membrane protein